MSRHGWRGLLAFCLAAVLAATVHGAAPTEKPQLAAPAPRLDRQGDPLPEGAVLRLGTYRLRHGSEMRAVAFAPDGKTVVSAGDGEFVRQWDLTTGKELRRFTGHTAILRAVEFSPDGKVLVAAGTHSHALYFWDVETGRYRPHPSSFNASQHLIPQDPVYHVPCLAFSPDGKTLVHARQEAHLYEAATGQHRSQLKVEGKEPWFICAAYAPDGKQLATGDQDGEVRLWDASGKPLAVLRGDRAAVLGLAYAPDGKVLASAARDGSIHLWNSITGKQLALLPGKEPVLSVRFTADGKGLLSGGSEGVTLWNVATGAKVRQFAGHNGHIKALALAPDGRLLAGAGSDGTLRLWEVPGGNSVLAFEGHRDGIDTLAFSRAGALLVSGGEDGIVMWDVQAGRVLRRIGGEKTRAESLAISADGRRLAAAEWRGLHLWDTATGKESISFPSVADDYPQQIVMTPEGPFLASRHESGRLHTWDPASGKLLHEFGNKRPDNQGWGFCVLSPDGRLIAVGGANETTQLWDRAERKLIRTLGEKTDAGFAAAFSPDSKLLATGDQDVHVWDVATGKELGRLTGHKLRMHALAFSADGRTLATATADTEIRLWEIASGQVRQRFVGHRGGAFPMGALAFSPDGALLATGGADTTILLWDVTGRILSAKPPALSLADLKTSWEDLASADATRAFASSKRLLQAPGQAVALLGEHVHPISRADPARLARLIEDLDSNEFAVRETATRALEKLGETAALALKEALSKGAAPEVRRRVEQLLVAMQPPLQPEPLRAVRAVEVLEHVGGAEAHRLLEALAGGAPEARLTREARAALARLTEPAANR